ncbi:MAG: FHA domain-containing protein, partial [Planctomycetes bacterium]|nr:FHA domain-containing protein [Planctomycetota bacterium]
MQDRYSLRFESGERAGEVVALTTARVTVGRKPGNTLQIAEASVSGSHAELVVEGSSVTVVDLGSTNGTRVGEEKVTERRLAHGDRVVFGSIALVFQDAQLADAAGSSAAGGLPDDDHDDVHSISAADLERSGKGSKVGLLVLLLVVLGGGGAAWFFLRGEGGGGRKQQPVVPVAGNLLASTYSFEGEESGWLDAEDAEAAFLQRPTAAKSGTQGMRAQLDGEERARLSSPVQRASVGRTLTARGSFDATDDAAGRLGIVFRFDGAEGHVPGEQIAWTAWSERDGGWTELEVSAAVPTGAASASVLVEARAAGGGTVDLDDVSLVESTGGVEPAVKHREFQGHLLGEPAQAFSISKANRFLVSDLRAEDPTDALRTIPLELVYEGEEFRVNLPGGANHLLSLRVEPASLEGGLASLGEGGRKTHGAQFERDDVEALLMGKGFDLTRLHFASPVRVESRPEGDGARVTIQLGAQRGAAIEVDFLAETAAARGLAEKARKAETENRMGDAFAAWRELRDVYPYDEALLAEAETSMARIAQAGLDALVEVGANVERARFFRLRDGYLACRAQAVVVGERYKGSVVETQALELVAEIDELASGLETDLAADEVRRLRGILTALEAS